MISGVRPFLGERFTVVILRILIANWLKQVGQEERGQHRLPTEISRMVKQLAATCLKTPERRHHQCCWGNRHQHGTALLSTFRRCTALCSSLLWPNVLYADDCGRRHWTISYLPCHLSPRLPPYTTAPPPHPHPPPHPYWILWLNM